MATTETSAGMTVIYRDDGIIEYRIADVSRATIDAWIEISYRHMLEIHNSGEYMRRLQIFNTNSIPTPYALSQASKLSKSLPNMQARLKDAFIVKNNIASNLISVFIRRLPERHVQQSIHIFKNEEEAIEWLNTTTEESDE